MDKKPQEEPDKRLLGFEYPRSCLFVTGVLLCCPKCFQVLAVRALRLRTYILREGFK